MKLLSIIGKVWPFLSFYIRNFSAVNDWVATGFEIAEKFRRDYPAVPPEKTPDADDVAAALRDSSAGRTGTLKKVRDWTPEEWERYWNHGSNPA